MSRLGRVARGLLPGLRQVHAQVSRYASAWEDANGRDLATAGPLWVVLGDSTAQGIGAPSWDTGYVGQLRRALDEGSQHPWRVLNEGSEHPWRVLNVSKSGARVADVDDRQLALLTALPTAADLVTCAIGANDMVRRTPTDELEATFGRIFGRLPANAVVATLPKGLHAERTEAINRYIRAEAPRAGLVVADVWAHTGPPWHGKLAADGFHPGALGYTDWAAAFAEALGVALPRRAQP